MGLKDRPAKFLAGFLNLNVHSKGNEIPTMTNYAVLIGNNEFAENSGLKNLSCPPHDVEGIKAVLTNEQRGQFLAENVSELINKTSFEVLEELNSKLKQKALDNLFLIYYSGHGLSSGNDLYLTTKNTKDGVLESTAISFEQIYKWIEKFGWKKVIIILDCCYSGLAGNAFKNSISAQLQSMNNQAMGTFLITATSNEKVAFDKTEGSQFSLFTKHLITALKSDEAEANEQGFISMDSLFRYVSKKVMDEKPEQRPKRFVKNEMGELFIAKSGRNSRKERAKKLKPYFLDLAKEELIEHEMLSEILRIIDMSVNELSKLDAQKDSLLGELYNTKKVARFMEHWYSLRGEKEPFVFSIFQVIGVLLLVIIGGIAGVIYALQGDDKPSPTPDIVITPTPVVTDNSQIERAKAAVAKAKAEAETKEKAAAALKAQQAANAQAEAELKAQQAIDAQAAGELAKQKQLAEAEEKTKQQAEIWLVQGRENLNKRPLTKQHIKTACNLLRNAAKAENETAKEILANLKCKN